MELEEVESQIKDLEQKKAALIEEIKKNYGRIRYKKYEEKALEPFLKETENVRVGPVRKRLRQLEFRISTQAFTPQMERQMVKDVKKVEEELKGMRQVERARRKKKLVQQDILDAEKRIAEIEEELKKIRETLKELYGKARTLKTAAKRGVTFGEKHENLVSLGDIVIIEEEEKK
ncbi:MAG: hypothetical protein AB1657_00675 [Candidatus Micrarchaeota archaeon]